MVATLSHPPTKMIGMEVRVCAVDGCDLNVRARGWCSAHYERWRTRGTVDLPPVPTPVERFWSKVQRVDSGCWEWQGWLTDGYGYLNVDGSSTGVHRFAYELLVGPIPEGLTIDHLCRNRHCVNPGHLEPVTMAENVRRSRPGDRTRDRAALMTHCKWGHPLTEDNIYWRPDRPGHRVCIACRNENSARSVRRRGQVGSG